MSVSIQEKAFQNVVCKMATILFRPNWWITDADIHCFHAYHLATILNHGIYNGVSTVGDTEKYHFILDNNIIGVSL